MKFTLDNAYVLSVNTGKTSPNNVYIRLACQGSEYNLWTVGGFGEWAKLAGTIVNLRGVISGRIYDRNQSLKLETVEVSPAKAAA